MRKNGERSPASWPACHTLFSDHPPGHLFISAPDTRGTRLGWWVLALSVFTYRTLQTASICRSPALPQPSLPSSFRSQPKGCLWESLPWPRLTSQGPSSQILAYSPTVIFLMNFYGGNCAVILRWLYTVMFSVVWMCVFPQISYVEIVSQRWCF